MELRSLRWRWPLLLLFFSGFCRTEIAPKYTFLKQATEAPVISSYDYIIVGGGTAGCPLAATLSQNFTVLLLERGGSPYGDTNITNLASFGNSLGDLSPTSASQRFVSEDGVINARARVLGGGSCLNAGFYTRASPKYVRRTGWDDGRLVNESYSWVERRVAFQPSMLQWQSAVRDGLLAAGVTPNNGFTFDHLYGTKIGGTIFDRHGNRHTAADLLGYADSKRLTVLLRATVKSILWRRGEGGRPAAKGVVYRDETGRRKRAYVRKGGEVVVAAGAMGSPQLLMLSGVGPREELERLGIKVLVAQPMVGKGMADNPMNAVFVPSPVPVEISLIQVVGITKFGSYIEAASGQLFAASGSGGSSRGSGSHGSGDDRDGGGDPAATNLDIFFPQTRKFPTGPPEQTTPEAITGKDKPAFRGGFIIEKVTGPVSTGHLELRSRNPDDNPAVTFNYFKDRRDLRRCIKGIKTIEKVIQSEPFRKFRFPGISMQALLNLTIQFPVNLRPRHNNDTTSLEQYCKDTVMTIWHYHGGCQVGRVVDRNYRVLGVDALRVIDGSTFNTSPGTNPQATVMMLGRYMGVKILEERLRAKKED